MPFSFDAPGWYVTGLLLLVATGVLAFRLMRYYQRNRYRAAALRWLDENESLYDADLLLKRIAMRRYGRGKVAALRDMAWINFLNSCWKEKSFTAADARLLNDVLYAGTSAEGQAGFIARAKRWVRYHRHALRDST